MRARQPGERLFSFVMLALALGFAWQAHGISGFSSLSSPGAFPMAASAAMVIAAIAIVLETARRPAADEPAASVLPRVLVGFFFLILVLALVLDRLGFLLAASGFLLASIGFLDRRGPWRTLGSALLAVILVYVVFRLVFKVVLPEGVVPERLILAAIGDFVASLLAERAGDAAP